jgi:hypothetical protein
MWLPGESKAVLVRFQSRGQNVETAWAEDLGSVPARPGARRVRLGNVLCLHSKPTYGDVLVVERALPGGVLTWDSFGLPPSRIKERIDDDGGRYMVALEYSPDPPSRDAREVYRALSVAGDHADIIVEGCLGPEKGRPGLACLAVPYRLRRIDVLRYLRRKNLPVTFRLVGPVDG